VVAAGETLPQATDERILLPTDAESKESGFSSWGLTNFPSLMHV